MESPSVALALRTLAQNGSLVSRGSRPANWARASALSVLLTPSSRSQAWFQRPTLASGVSRGSCHQGPSRFRRLGQFGRQRPAWARQRSLPTREFCQRRPSSTLQRRAIPQLHRSACATRPRALRGKAFAVSLRRSPALLPARALIPARTAREGRSARHQASGKTTSSCSGRRPTTLIPNEECMPCRWRAAERCGPAQLPVRLRPPQPELLRMAEQRRWGGRRCRWTPSAPSRQMGCIRLAQSRCTPRQPQRFGPRPCKDPPWWWATSRPEAPRLA